jgi:hypothetical protein
MVLKISTSFHFENQVHDVFFIQRYSISLVAISTGCLLFNEPRYVTRGSQLFLLTGNTQSLFVETFLTI